MLSVRVIPTSPYSSCNYEVRSYIVASLGNMCLLGGHLICDISVAENITEV